MIKICFVLPDLNGGGAQRTLINLANRLSRTEFQVSMAFFDLQGSFAHELNPDVKTINLDTVHPRKSIIKLVALFKAQKPDLVFSSLLYTNAAAVAAAWLADRRIRRVVRETNNWTTAGRKKYHPSDLLVGLAYRGAHKVVCLSRGVAADCRFRYNLRPAKMQVIYNPIDIGRIEAMAAQQPEGPVEAGAPGDFHLLAVGRLTRQKGFDLLLRALAGLPGVPWRLTILGEGEDRGKLEGLAAELGINGRVSLPGFVANPYAWMRRADLFVLSSRWEGFGHVIAEAMVCGAPVLATRCPSGPEEIISDGRDGVLCQAGSVEDLRDKLAQLAQEPELRRRLSVRARQSVQRFAINKIVGEYESLFKSCVWP